MIGVGRGTLECYDDNSGILKSSRMCDGYKCSLRVNRAAMMPKVNVTITQQITLYLLDQTMFNNDHKQKKNKKTEIFA